MMDCNLSAESNAEEPNEGSPDDDGLLSVKFKNIKIRIKTGNLRMLNQNRNCHFEFYRRINGQMNK